MVVHLLFYTVMSFAIDLDAILNTVSNCIWDYAGKIRIAFFLSKGPCFCYEEPDKRMACFAI